MSGVSAKNEPQMNADERRFVVPGVSTQEGLARAQRAWQRQWRREPGRGLDSVSGRARGKQ